MYRPKLGAVPIIQNITHTAAVYSTYKMVSVYSETRRGVNQYVFYYTQRGA